MNETLQVERLSYGLIRHVGFSLETAAISVLLDPSEEEIEDLVRILNGTAENYRGEVFVSGKPVKLNSVAVAQNAGIFCVGRSSILIPNLSIEDNLGLLEPVDNSFFFNHKRSHELARYFLERFNIKADPEALPSELSEYEYRELEMFKAITLGARLIVMSAFFESFTPEERIRLTERMKLLTTLGITVFIMLSRPHPELIGCINKVITVHNGTIGLTKYGDEADSKMRLPSVAYPAMMTAAKNANPTFAFEFRKDGKQIISAASGEVTAVYDRNCRIPETEYEARQYLFGTGKLRINGKELVSLETVSGSDREFAVACYSYDAPRVLKNLSVQDNICLRAGRLISRSVTINTRINRYLCSHVLSLSSYFRELNEHLDDPDCSLLGDTELRELEVARAVICQPSVLLLLTGGLKDSVEKTGQLYQMCHIFAHDYRIAVIAVFHEMNDVKLLRPDRQIRLE